MLNKAKYKTRLKIKKAKHTSNVYLKTRKGRERKSD